MEQTPLDELGKKNLEISGLKNDIKRYANVVSELEEQIRIKNQRIDTLCKTIRELAKN